MTKYKTSYDNSYALVVAIDEYQHLNPLETAVRGANEVAQLLRTNFGFNVQTLFNGHASRESILSWFYSLKAKCSPDDRILFYFAGHGLTEKSPSGQAEAGYLALPVTMKNSYDTSLSMDEIIRRIEMLSAKHMLVLLDACFGGVILTQTRSIEPDNNVSTQKFAEVLISRPVRYAITAGGSEAVDDNAAPGGNYSLFSYYLLKGLQGDAQEAEGLLRARNLANYLEKKVGGSRLSRHKPKHGHIGVIQDGDFVFEFPDLSSVEDESHFCKILDPRGILDNHSTSILQRLKKSSKLTIIEEISVGQSGSRVYLVDVTGIPQSDLEGLHFCKLYKTPSGEEKQIYEKISRSNIGGYIPALVDNSSVVEGWTASLYSPAHQTTRRGMQSLANLLAKNMLASVEAVIRLTEVLNGWNSPSNDRKNTDPYSLLRLPLRRFMSGSNLVDVGITERIEEHVDGFTPNVSRILFANYSQVLPNPVSFLSSEKLWRGSRSILWPSGHVHGDLHSNNILCLLDQRSQTVVDFPAVIDFDTYDSESCVFYDFAYLEIDFALLMLNPIDLDNRKIWPQISEYLIRNIELQPIPPLEPRYYPLHGLLIPIRNAVSKLCQQQPGDFEVAYWISRTSAGLSLARKRRISSAQRLLALLIAAHSLKKVLDELEIEYGVDEEPVWIRWTGLDET